MKQGQDMMSNILQVGIHHHEPFLFCVYLVAALRAYIIPYPQMESQWGCV